MKVLKWLIPVLLVLGIAAFFGGKYWVKEKAPEAFSIERVNISIGQDSIFLKIGIKVPTNKPVKRLIDSMRYRVHFDTVQFSSGIKNFNTEPSDTFISLPLGMDREKLFSTIKKMQVKDSTNLNIELEPFISTKLTGKKVIPVKITRKMRVPIPPDVTVAALKVDDFGLREVGLDATLQVVNLNDFEFIIANGTISLDFIEMFQGTVQMKEPVHLKSRDTTLIDVDIEIEDMKLAKTAWRMGVKKENVVYDINGLLYVTTVDNPDDTIDVVLRSPGLRLKEKE